MADGSKTFDFSGKRALGEDVIDTMTIKTKEYPDGQDFDIRAMKDSAPMFLAHKLSVGDNTQKLVAVIDFMHSAMTPESAERFEELATDPINGLDWEEIVEIFQYVLGVVSGNPTGLPSGSSTVQRKTGSSSRARTSGRPVATR